MADEGSQTRFERTDCDFPGQESQEIPLDAIPMAHIEDIIVWDNESRQLSVSEIHKRPNATSTAEALLAAPARLSNDVAAPNSDAEIEAAPNAGSSKRMANVLSASVMLSLAGKGDNPRPLAKRASEDGGTVLHRNPIEIRTSLAGHNAGRVYHLRAGGEAECTLVARRVWEYSVEERRRLETKTRLEEIQARCRAVYLSMPAQVFIGVLIIAVRRMAT